MQMMFVAMISPRANTMFTDNNDTMFAYYGFATHALSRRQS